MKTGPRKCEYGILWNISLTGDILYDGSKYTEQYYAQQEFVDGETTRLFRPSVRPVAKHISYSTETQHMTRNDLHGARSRYIRGKISPARAMSLHRPYY